MKQVLVWPFLFIIGLYRKWLSPLIPSACRYEPTCSQYAVTALQRHGILYGGWLAAKRIASCNPLGGHGHDPVPPSKHNPTHS